MKFNIRILAGAVAIFFMANLQANVIIEKPFDNNKLKKLAVVDGYGYKYANLTFLQKYIIETLNAWLKNDKKLSYKFAVPVFVGIPSNKILAFVKDKLGYDLAQKWSDSIKKGYLTDENKESIFKTKQYPNGFEQARAKIEEDVCKAFDDYIKNVKDEDELVSFDSMFDVRGIGSFLENLDESARLMVRSTGKEDTDELANAGGNETIANVTIETRAILIAMKKVVASYVGKKSLTQRLGAEDPSLFIDDSPFTPVLLQLMIGEKDPTKLPRCGVMFTEEVEGGASRYKKIDVQTKAILTTMITIIQAAYGHNEGVVNSLIPVDTFYAILRKIKETYAIDHIYTVIRPKTHRVKPSQDKETPLEMTENNDTIAIKSPALEKETTQALAYLARALEEFYQKPMDVEFVVNTEEKVIYLVQARPIVHADLNKFKPPTYLALPANFPTTKIITGSSIGVAGGATRIIKNKKQIIVSDSMGSTLDAYQNPAVDRNKVECIITGRMAPATSHEATTFRSELKPVTYIQNWQKVEEWVQDGSLLLISPQQEMVVNIGSGDIEKEWLKTGWCNYPIPQQVSMMDEYHEDYTTPVGPSLNEMQRNEIIELSTKGLLLTQDPNKQNSRTGISWLLEVIKTAPKEDAAFALARLYLSISKEINKIIKSQTIDESFLSEMKSLQNLIDSCVRMVSKTIQYQPEDTINYPRRLFAIRFLESALLQQPAYGEIINGYSYALTVLRGIVEEQNIAKETGVTSPYSAALLRMRDAALTDEASKLLLSFVKKLDQTTGNEKQAFSTLVSYLFSLGVLPTWLHTSFITACKNLENTDTQTIISKIKNEISTDKKFFETLKEKRAALKVFGHDALAKPKEFKGAWETIFTKKFLNYFTGKEFTDAFKNAQQLAKLTAIGVMRDLVETIDLSIKALSRSKLYEGDEEQEKQLINFSTMLKQNLALFRTFMQLIPPGTITYNASTLQQNSNGYDAYAGYIDQVLSKKSFTGSDLLATSQFNVSAFTITSGVNIQGGGGLILPGTLEDAFTTIHQNQIAALNTLSAINGADKIERPKLLGLVEERIKKITSSDPQSSQSMGQRSPSLMGCDIKESSMVLYYNLPLRNHSAQFDITYLKKSRHAGNKDHVIATIRLFGHLPDRWYKIGAWYLLAHAAAKLDVIAVDFNDNGVAASVGIDAEEKVDFVLQVLQKTLWATDFNPQLLDSIDAQISIPTIRELKNSSNLFTSLQKKMTTPMAISALMDQRFSELLKDIDDKKKASLAESFLQAPKTMSFLSGEISKTVFNLFASYFKSDSFVIPTMDDFINYSSALSAIISTAKPPAGDAYDLLSTINKKYGSVPENLPTGIETLHKLLLELQNNQPMITLIGAFNQPNKTTPLIFVDQSTQNMCYMYLMNSGILRILVESTENKKVNLKFFITTPSSNWLDSELAIYIKFQENNLSITADIDKQQQQQQQPGPMMGMVSQSSYAIKFSTSIDQSQTTNLKAPLNALCEIINGPENVSSNIIQKLFNENDQNKIKGALAFAQQLSISSLLDKEWLKSNIKKIIISDQFLTFFKNLVDQNIFSTNLWSIKNILDSMLTLTEEEKKPLPYDYNNTLTSFINELVLGSVKNFDSFFIQSLVDHNLLPLAAETFVKAINLYIEQAKKTGAWCWAGNLFSQGQKHFFTLYNSNDGKKCKEVALQALSESFDKTTYSDILSSLQSISQNDAVSITFPSSELTPVLEKGINTAASKTPFNDYNCLVDVLGADNFKLDITLKDVMARTTMAKHLHTLMMCGMTCNKNKNS